jgi:23S rRNA pseudouridine1911/1915/1917 synthase
VIEREVRGPSGELLKPSHRVRFGDVITIFRDPPPEPEVPTDFAVLFEDDELYVVDKPSGLPVHPTARFFRNTLTWLLRQRYGDGRPLLVHRLDRETSGVLVCAKTKDSERCLKRQFAERTVKKEYLAIVRGAPAFGATVIDIPLGPASGSEIRIRMGPRQDAQGQAARTAITVLEKLEGCSLVSARPLTGRQHQIRAHLAAIGHPVIGDKIYGEDEHLFIDFVEGEMTLDSWRRLELRRHALHAHRVELVHPSSGEAVAFESPLADDLAEFLATRRAPRPGGLGA